MTAGQAKQSRCALCLGTLETVEHFLLYCPALASCRDPYLAKMSESLKTHRVIVPNDCLGMVKLILTPAVFVNEQSIPEFETLPGI